MPNPPDSRDAQAWEIYLAFLTGKTGGDKKLARSGYKAADAFETVRAGHEESLKEPPAKSLKGPAEDEKWLFLVSNWYTNFGVSSNGESIVFPQGAKMAIGMLN